MNKAEMLKQARETAKRFGYTFKVQPFVLLNGKTVYMLADRKTGDVVAQYIQLDEHVHQTILNALPN